MRLVMQIIALFAVVLAVVTWWLPFDEEFDSPVFTDYFGDV